MRPPTEAWGISGDLIPLPGGYRNTVLSSTGADPVVFKSTRRDEAAIEWLLPVLAAAQSVGFVVPVPVRSRAGRLVEGGWTCEPFLEGKAFDPAGLASLQSAIGDFHAAAARLPQRPGFRSSQELLTELAGGDVDLSAMPDDIVRACRAAWRRLADQPDGVIHGDLSAGNLLVAADGSPVLLDWDECRRDLLSFDLTAMGGGTEAERQAALAWEVACCWQIEPQRARDLGSQLVLGQSG